MGDEQGMYCMYESVKTGDFLHHRSQNSEISAFPVWAFAFTVLRYLLPLIVSRTLQWQESE